MVEPVSVDVCVLISLYALRMSVGCTGMPIGCIPPWQFAWQLVPQGSKGLAVCGQGSELLLRPVGSCICLPTAQHLTVCMS